MGAVKLYSPCCGAGMIKANEGEHVRACVECGSSWFLIKCVERVKKEVCHPALEALESVAPVVETDEQAMGRLANIAWDKFTHEVVDTKKLSYDEDITLGPE